MITMHSNTILLLSCEGSIKHLIFWKKTHKIQEIVLTENHSVGVMIPRKKIIASDNKAKDQEKFEVFVFAISKWSLPAWEWILWYNNISILYYKALQ